MPLPMVDSVTGLSASAASQAVDGYRHHPVRRAQRACLGDDLLAEGRRAAAEPGCLRGVQRHPAVGGQGVVRDAVVALAGVGLGDPQSGDRVDRPASRRR